MREGMMVEENLGCAVWEQVGELIFEELFLMG